MKFLRCGRTSIIIICSTVLKAENEDMIVTLQVLYDAIMKLENNP